MDNPLTNPGLSNIHLNIFKQLPHDGKKSFRQVSQLWEDSTLQSWRNNALVKIVKERIETNPSSSLNSLTSKSTGITLQEFVELIKTQTEPYRFSENKPFRSFQLQELHFLCPPYKTNGLEDEDRNGALVESLFEKIGPTIHHLQFDSFGTIRSERVVDALKWILLKACVNLKGLQIDPSILLVEDQSEPLSPPVDFVQEKALNLATLKLAYYSSDLRWTAEESREFWNIIPNLKNLELNISGSLELIKQLKHPLDSGKFIKLERVHLNGLALTNEETNDAALIVDLTNYIATAKPPLTKVYLGLDLDLGNLKNAQDSFKAFLESCKDTLTSLSVLLNEVDETNQSERKEWITELSGVTLPNLTSLWLQYDNYEQFNGDALKSGPKNFDFGALQGFPKLKKLTVQLYGDEKIENELPCGKWLTEGKLQYGNVDEEQLGDDYLIRNELLEDFNFWSYKKFDCESFRKLASWMPSIKYLAVDADKTTLPIILTSFPELKRLSLLDGSSVSGDTLKELKKTYPRMEINMLDFEQSFTKCEMPDYF